MNNEKEVRDILDFFPHPGPLAQSPSYVYFGSILEAFAKEKLVGDLWKYLVEALPNEQDQLIAARRLREGLLKSSPLVGFPRGINGLAALRTAIRETSPEVQKILDGDNSMRGPVDKEARIKRGKAFFEKVYAQHAERVMKNMSLSSGGDLSEFAVTGIYGDLMAEETILSGKETGLLEFACCYASGAAPQAKGHAYGSRNLGNTRDEVLAVVEMCRRVARLLGFPLDESEMTFVDDKVRKWDA